MYLLLGSVKLSRLIQQIMARGSPLGWAVELACPVTPDLPQGSFYFLSLGSLRLLQGDPSLSHGSQCD